MPYIQAVQTVVETPAFLQAARGSGMTEAERNALVTDVAREPTGGVLIVGSGGCRKRRVAGKGRGKSGGYRVITFYAGPDDPVFLLTVFAKGERSNLSDADTAALAVLAKRLLASLRSRIRT